MKKELRSLLHYLGETGCWHHPNREIITISDILSELRSAIASSVHRIALLEINTQPHTYPSEARLPSKQTGYVADNRWREQTQEHQMEISRGSFSDLHMVGGHQKDSQALFLDL